MPELVLRQMLNDWIKAARAVPSRNDTGYFSAFLEWGQFNGVAMPATGEDVACFLTEMLISGCSLQDIKRAASAIIQAYKMRREFLDLLPIEGAVAMCREQLKPNRIIH